MIGILYPHSLLSRLLLGKKSFEQPSFYMDAVHKTGQDIVFFSLSDINWIKGTIRGWNGKDRVRIKRPIPKVIINRTRTNQMRVKLGIQKLIQLGSIVFNEYNVISKLEVHHLLSQNPKLLPHLPATKMVTYHSVRDMLEQHTALFLKPHTASVGNGIIRIKKTGGDTIAEINRLGRVKRKRVSLNGIVRIVRIRKREYLIQQGIDLMKYKGRRTDFRVSIQKNGSGHWEYTGAVGKVSRRGAIVTNIHCGGKSKKAAKLFEHWGWNGAEIEKKFAELGLLIAKTLEQHLPRLADLGLDMAVDKQQRIWFIEANLRDMRITFRDAGELEKWRATFATPVQYAAYLLKQAQKEQVSIAQAPEEQPLLIEEEPGESAACFTDETGEGKDMGCSDLLEQQAGRPKASAAAPING